MSNENTINTLERLQEENDELLTEIIHLHKSMKKMRKEIEETRNEEASRQGANGGCLDALEYVLGLIEWYYPDS